MAPGYPTRWLYRQTLLGLWEIKKTPEGGGRLWLKQQLVPLGPT
jgi:hypothetical protein